MFYQVHNANALNGTLQHPHHTPPTGNPLKISCASGCKRPVHNPHRNENGLQKSYLHQKKIWSHIYTFFSQSFTNSPIEFGTFPIRSSRISPYSLYVNRLCTRKLIRKVPRFLGLSAAPLGLSRTATSTAGPHAPPCNGSLELALARTKGLTRTMAKRAMVRPIPSHLLVLVANVLTVSAHVL